MVIIELMRRVVGLAQGATAEVAVYGDRDRDLAERWCANTGNTLVRADVDQTGVGTLVVRRGHPPDPASVLGPDRLPGVRLWLYTNFHCNLLLRLVVTKHPASRTGGGADRPNRR